MSAPGAYLALVWPAQDAEAAAQAERLRRSLDTEPGWKLRAERAGLLAWAASGSTLGVTPLPRGGVLLGDLHAPPDDPGLLPSDLVARLPADPLVAARRLTRGAWGRYVALFAGNGEAAAFRDPSGARPCLVWRRGAVWVAAAHLEDAPRGWRPPHAALDWRRIAGWLADPVSVEEGVALSGVASVRAGALAVLGQEVRLQTVWTPAQFAGSSTADADEARRRLPEVVDHCTAHLLGLHARAVVEVSGGFDSAVVADAVRRSERPVAAWLNYFGDRREGDERAYAEAVADRLGVRLCPVQKPLEAIGPDSFADLLDAARPPTAALDPARDRDTARRLAALGADALVSGQGGDAVFFQMPTPLVAADLVRARGWPAAFGRAASAQALWTRRSMWGQLWEVMRAQRGDPLPAARTGLAPGFGAPLHTPRAAWLREADGLPHGKRMQIAALANAQLFRTETRRSRAADVVFPLLAQPVVELCLAIPTYELARRGRDRALAREAFAERAPAAVLERRSKGDLGSFYGRTVAASLGFLRPFLLDGCLCEAGLIDRQALDAALSVESLVWHGRASAILQAAAIESWVRHWQTRAPDATGAGRPRR